MTDAELIKKTTEIFFPHAAERTESIKRDGGRFAYYTSAETATRVLVNREVWMRNTSTMNDYMEIQHGFGCLNDAYKDEKLGPRFKAAINSCFEGLAEETEALFNAWLPTIREDTYITCVSEHAESEDVHGRLSMWRAYGGRSGVALVLNGDVMFGSSNVLGAYSSPVGYFDHAMMKAHFQSVISNIETSSQFLQTMGRERLKNVLFTLLRFAVLCTKHKGFHEEKEWRVIASPRIHGQGLLTSAVEVVRNIPQIVYKIGLQDHPELDFVGLALPALLDRIIIGPTEFPLAVRMAFISLLKDAGVADPESKVVLSDIPLRNID